MRHKTLNHSQRPGQRTQGLIMSFSGKKTFLGSREENLDSFVSVYETVSNMCKVSSEDRLKAIPSMLFGNDFNYYLSNIQGC